MIRGPQSLSDRAPLADGLAVASLSLVVRLVCVVWASSRFEPAEDGHYYHVVAGRIAHGLGYTWQWPDGAITYAAHYPVGYPALVGAAYAAFGAEPWVAMSLNAVLGAVATLAVHRVAATCATRKGALIGAVAIGLHPGLVFYTPALMTEGATASLLAIAAWLAVRQSSSRMSSWTGVAGLSLVLGVATLVRPQSLLLAPVYGALATGAALARRRVLLAGLVTAGAIAVCLPWTFRNCSRMHSCALVSVNAGWNLFIGAAPGATGSWVPLEKLGVPVECRTVWDEAAKDACFFRAGLRAIAEAPGRWAALVPRKLAETFDYAGAAGFYLHSSNPRAFDDREKFALGTLETVWERLIVVFGLVAAARARGPRSRARRAIAALSAVWLMVRSAWVAHLGLVVAAGLLGRRLATRPPLAVAAGTVLVTALTHAVFFGAGRYSLVCFPALAALAGTALTAEEGLEDTERSKES